jgi:hypothetical protein
MKGHAKTWEKEATNFSGSIRAPQNGCLRRFDPTSGDCKLQIVDFRLKIPNQLEFNLKSQIWQLFSQINDKVVLRSSTDRSERLRGAPFDQLAQAFKPALGGLLR